MSTTNNYEKRKLNIGTETQFNAQKSTLPVGSEWGLTDFISIDDLDDSLKNKINYPVGAIFITTDNTTSPAQRYGGTWEQIKDTFLLSAGDTYTAGATGGSADAVVVSHMHEVLTGASAGYTEGGQNQNMVTTDGWWVRNVVYTTTSSGESGTGKNMPPYLVVYVWKRVA